MGAVDIGVRHDHDLVVAQLLEVEFLVADRGAERLDQSPDFFRPEHPVEARALHVQDLALERKDRLVVAVTALLGRAAGAVTLDEEQLRESRIALLTVGELSGKRARIERAFSPRQLARLARGFAGTRSVDDLLDDAPRLARVLLEVVA